MKWVMVTGREVGSIWYIEESQFEKRLEDLNTESWKSIAELVGSGAMTLDYSPERKRTGRHDARAADCMVRLIPDVLDALSEN